MSFRDISRLDYTWKVPAPEFYALNYWGNIREGELHLRIRQDASGRFYLILNAGRVHDQWFQSESQAIEWGMKAGKEEQEKYWAKQDPINLQYTKERLARKASRRPVAGAPVNKT